MRGRSLGVSAALAMSAALALSAAPAVSAAPAAAVAVEVAPRRADQIVVDDAHRRVFVTGDRLSVFDFTGALVKQYPFGASSLALQGSTLYYDGVREIDSLDTGTLALHGRFAQLLNPVLQLAWADGQLWATVQPSVTRAGYTVPLVSFDARGVIEHNNDGPTSGSPALIAVPGAPTTLWSLGGRGRDLTRLSLADGVATSAASVYVDSFIDPSSPGKAVSPDASRLLVSVLSPRNKPVFAEFDATTLRPTGTSFVNVTEHDALAAFQIGGAPRWAIGGSGVIRVFASGQAAALRTIRPAGDYAGLAASADGRRLFVVLTTDGRPSRLQVVVLGGSL